MITVIYTIRDRDPERLANSVNSLRAHSTVGFDVIVVDYGSRAPVAEKIRHLCEEMSLQLVRCESEGLPWCKSHALNIGVRHADTEYVVFTDIDILFESDILDVSLKHTQPGIAIHCKPWWLRRNGDRNKASLADDSHVGGYQFIRRDTVMSMGGFDERIRYWGNEDIEWVLRLKKRGVRVKWIESEASICHVWHPPLHGIGDERPGAVEPESWRVISGNLLSDSGDSEGTGGPGESTGNSSHAGDPYSSDTPAFPGRTVGAESPADPQEWGVNITREMRPVLSRLETEEPLKIEINRYLIDLLETMERIGDRKFVCFDLGERFMGGSIRENKYRWFTILRHQLFGRFRLRVTRAKNLNFDQWYSSLPYLQKKGLIDYYILKNKQRVYLLFE